MAENNNSLIEFGLGSFLFEEKYDQLVELVQSHVIMHKLDIYAIDRLVMILLLNSMNGPMPEKAAFKQVKEELGEKLNAVADIDVHMVLRACLNYIEINPL
jgi:hypothetical protein